MTAALAVLRPGLCTLLYAAGTLLLHAQEYEPPPILKDGFALLIENYASAPLSSRGGSLQNPTAPINFSGQLSRINFLRSEPPDAPLAHTRFFVPDLNRNLYILDRSNRAFSVYINFQAVFPKFDNDEGHAGGLITVAFDPAYASNGVFYTVHMENPNDGGSALPVNTALPGLDTTGYELTPVVNPPAGAAGFGARQAVLVEWTDDNIANATFEGTVRELLRVGFNSRIHPMGDLAFNPLAGPGHPDYRNLYIANGDGGAGELPTNDDGVPGVTAGDRHHFPQRLDTLVGKILRITPDLALRPDDLLSANGRYRIPSTGPDPNPFVNTNGARPEIFAVGFRNPHRMSWDVETGALFVHDIGRFTFEEVNIVKKGGNYGWAAREGTRRFFPTISGGDWPPGSDTHPLPVPDQIPWRLNAVTTNLGLVTPFYPVAEYFQDQGDAISSGFVYRGSAIPRLRGKYVFGDITTARLFYCDIEDMLAAHDTDPATLAKVREVQVVFDSPYDTPDAGPVKRRLFDMIGEEFTSKGGSSSGVLPGVVNVTSGVDPYGVPYGRGRADIRLAEGGDGELYLFSKTDAMIRRAVAVVAPPTILSIVATNGQLEVAWESIAEEKYRVQHTSSLADPEWEDIPGTITASGSKASAAFVVPAEMRFYRVLVEP
ncbi:MAG TPA: PQQ-dependent sugar dehydrogenase [Verrucomicrobia bacterium]|nr:PQQ-dependent sugar dehydrogenase [Verrucomicrobiota bacterium]HOP98463.1 PQQ-dependent sugar dehydrogenase [Verrucomicrobiota bacterium]HPU55122.1 PQQ-dependent sugar dehydrogenase [Verrucomicrobiota bacterium]